MFGYMYLVFHVDGIALPFAMNFHSASQFIVTIRKDIIVTTGQATLPRVPSSPQLPVKPSPHPRLPFNPIRVERVK